MTTGSNDVSRETSQPLPLWAEASRPGLTAYAELLATIGVERGLIGPREVPRLWSRHILNCLVVAEPTLGLIAPGAVVADVGSGAGLPGMVWALARPDVSVVLLEPLLRRSTFLTEACTSLGVDGSVTVVRARAEDVVRAGDWVGADVVTARAVAPLDRLLGWTVPLLRAGGRLVALKGSTAADEIAAAQTAAQAVGITDLRVVLCGEGVIDPPTCVVVGERSTAE